MAYNKAFRTPTQLTGVARGAYDALVEKYQTSTLLPTQENVTLDYSFSAGDTILPAAASYRSFDAESMVNTTAPGKTRKGSLPPTSIRMPVGEYQQLTMMNRTDAIGAKFEEYAVRNGQAIAARVVLAQAEALVDGKVTLNERDLVVTIDFGRKAGLTANAATAWSTAATADPLTDLDALRAVFGKRVDSVTISRQAMSYLQRSVELIKMATGRGGDLVSRISEADVRSVLGDFGYGTLVVNEETVIGRDGVERPLFASNKVLFTAGGAVGTTQLGVTAESIDPENGIAQSEQPGLFAGAIKKEDPAGFNVYTSAIVLPVASAANNTAVLNAW